MISKYVLSQEETYKNNEVSGYIFSTCSRVDKQFFFFYHSCGANNCIDLADH